MKIFKLFILMIIVSLMTTSCSSKKHGCKGIKAHPNYKSGSFKK